MLCEESEGSYGNAGGAHGQRTARRTRDPRLRGRRPDGAVRRVGGKRLAAGALLPGGADSVLIDGEMLRVRQSAACGHPLALRRALNAAGEMVGAITGAYVDEETLAIAAVELTRGFWEDLKSGRQLVRHFEVHVPDADVVLMEEGDESDEAWMDQGDDRGRGSGRVGGDGIRHDELAGGAQTRPGGDERRTDGV